MVTIKYHGRLGNRMVQFAAGYILAKKTGLSLSTRDTWRYSNTKTYKTSCSKDNMILIKFAETFEIEFPTGKSCLAAMELNNSNYYQHLNKPLEGMGYILKDFFQDGRLLCDYRSDILDLYQCKKKPTIDISENDAFFACRFGDLLLKSNRTYCTIQYIESQLKANRHNYRNVYITSDSIDYPPLVQLINKYDLTIYQSDPLETILFAKNFDNLILSAGSFSYWMAYLSQATNISVYNNNDRFQRNNAWNYNKNVQFNL